MKLVFCGEYFGVKLSEVGRSGVSLPEQFTGNIVIFKSNPSRFPSHDPRALESGAIILPHLLPSTTFAKVRRTSTREEVGGRVGKDFEVKLKSPS